jgi:hypothetical protein
VSVTYRPPSFYQYDGLAPGDLAGFTLGDMYVFSDSTVVHDEGALFYTLLIDGRTPSGGSVVEAQCGGRKMFVGADRRAIFVQREPRGMKA